MKQHLTPTGWKKCSATKQPCKYSFKKETFQPVIASEIAEYIQSKGFPYNKQLSPVAALRQQLTYENHGRTLQVVENAKNVTILTLPASEVFIPNLTHYRECEPRPIPSGGYGGVLFYRDNKYYLLDGYHRLKWVKQEEEPHFAVQYFLLS